MHLGHVLRAQRNFEGAVERFVQCVTLARKHSLQKVLFRAAYQVGELAINTPPEHSFVVCSRASLFELMKTTVLQNALGVVR